MNGVNGAIVLDDSAFSSNLNFTEHNTNINASPQEKKTLLSDSEDSPSQRTSEKSKDPGSENLYCKNF